MDNGFLSRLLRVSEAEDPRAELEALSDDGGARDDFGVLALTGHGLSSQRFVLRADTPRFVCDFRKLLPPVEPENDERQRRTADRIRALCRFVYVALSRESFRDGDKRLFIRSDELTDTFSWWIEDETGDVVEEHDTWEGVLDIIAGDPGDRKEDFIRV